MLFIAMVAVVALMLSCHALLGLWRLGTIHNNLVAEFREFRAKFDYDGEPFTDDEVDDWVQSVVEPPGIARCLVCEELGHDCPTHDMGEVSE